MLIIDVKDPILIICPLSVISHWSDEVKKYTNNINCITYFGSIEERKKFQDKWDNSVKVFIIYKYRIQQQLQF